MSALSNYLENKLIDQIFRGQAYSFPGTLYFALFTATPSDTGGGTEVSTTGTNYARKSVVASLANFAATSVPGGIAVSAGTDAVTSNNASIVFNAPTGGTNWGTITAVGVFDAATAGNLLVWGTLTTPKTVNNGDAAPSFSTGAFVFTLDT
ncbi:MAG: hypothetical protein IPL32_17840 [Chloracidobacterium sp.]|nr:hypothetical protein [Chloracidobacterium sp.]